MADTSSQNADKLLKILIVTLGYRYVLFSDRGSLQLTSTI